MDFIGKFLSVLSTCTYVCTFSHFQFIGFIGVLRHMQGYFSHICDNTDVQADWRRRCTCGRAPNGIYISQGSLTCPSYTDTVPPFLYGDSDTPPHLVAFYDTPGIRRTYSRLNPPPPGLRKKMYRKKRLGACIDKCFQLRRLILS